MKPNINYRTILVLAGLFAIISCNKNEEVPAEKVFTGSGMFWYQGSVGDSLEASGSHLLSFYLDSQLVGTSPIYHGSGDGWYIDVNTLDYIPSCGADSTFNYSISWKAIKYHTFTYTVKDQTGKVLWWRTFVLTTDYCVSAELTL